MTTVAIVGTGRMGSAMARALGRAGHELVLFKAKLEEWVAQSQAPSASTPTDNKKEQASS